MLCLLSALLITVSPSSSTKNSLPAHYCFAIFQHQELNACHVRLSVLDRNGRAVLYCKLLLAPGGRYLLAEGCRCVTGLSLRSTVTSSGRLQHGHDTSK